MALRLLRDFRSLRAEMYITYVSFRVRTDGTGLRLRADLSGCARHRVKLAFSLLLHLG